MKSSKTEIHAKFHKIPRLRYCEERKLTSYSGLVIFQALFHSIGAAVDILLFHNGRGSQEKLFGEAKQNSALDVIPTRRKIGNQIFILAGMLAHNLGRELQMATRPADRGDLEKRPAKWEFENLGTIRQHLLHNAGTLARPQGELTLTMNANDAVRDELTRYLDGLMKNAA